MRFILLSSLLTAGAWAQSVAPADVRTGFALRPGLFAIPAAAPARCSIPMPNALGPRALRIDQKMITPLPEDWPQRYAILYARAPAPACKDTDR